MQPEIFQEIPCSSFKVHNYCPSEILHIVYAFLPILHSIPLNLQLKIHFFKDLPTAHFISSSTIFFRECAMSPRAHAKDMWGKGEENSRKADDVKATVIQVSEWKGDPQKSRDSSSQTIKDREGLLHVIQEENWVESIVHHPTEPFPKPFLKPPKGSKGWANPNNITTVLREAGGKFSRNKSFWYTPY